MFQNFYNRIRQAPLAIISFFVALANWQLLFGLKASQWDMINFWLPWRRYISECYTNGIVPLWNPYSQAGYPLHGDLQGPAYSPETILTSFLPVNIYSLNFLYIFYLIVGAYGLYKLVLFFVKALPNTELLETSRNVLLLTASVAGVAYGICGYNAWHGHYLYITISACLIPWIYYYFFRILEQPVWTDCLKLALFIWWQVTAGNPSFIIVSFYFLALTFIIRFLYNYRKKQGAQNKKILLHIVYAAVPAAILCAPVFLNAWYVFPESSRAGGISAEWAAEESILWRNIFSIFSSITSIEREIRIGMEAPIYNLYIGIPALFFALFAIIRLRSFWIHVFSVIAILAFLLSLGLQTPLFRLFHAYLPFFNVFRMPNLIIIYTLMYLCVMSALGFLYLYRKGISTRHFTVFSGAVIFILCIGVLYFKYVYPEKEIHATDESSLRSFLWTASQARKTAISVVLAAVVLGFCFYFIKKKNYKALFFVIMLDVVFNYNLGAVARVIGEPGADYSNSFLHGIPEGFGPVDNIAGNKTNNLTSRMNALWMNASTFLQQPSYLNDNNFELSNYMKLLNEHPEELNYFISQNQAFLADSLVKHEDFKPDTLRRRTIATLSDSSLHTYKTLSLKRSAGDTIRCTKFFPHHFLFEVKNEEAVAFVLQQNFTKLWKVTLNGKEIRPSLSYYSFPLIPLQKGTNTIEFRYDAPGFKALFMISLAGGGGMILLIVWFGPLRKKSRILAISALLLLFAGGSFSFIKGRNRLWESTLEKELSAHTAFSTQYPAKLQIINTRDGLKGPDSGNKHHFNLLFNEDLAEMLSKLRNCKDEYISYTCYKSLHSDEAEALIRFSYGEPVAEEKISYGFIRIYKRNPQTASCIWKKENNFDTDQHAWTIKDTVSGNTQIKLMKGNEYGGGSDFIVKDIGAGIHDLVYAECELGTSPAGMPGMCISIDRDGANKAFVAYGNVHRMNNKKIALVYRLPEWVKGTDKVTVFFWNNTDVPAIIDNMKTQVIKMDL